MNWTVWVGGSEVNDRPLTYQQAKDIAKAWRNKGYDDVKMERVLEWQSHAIYLVMSLP